MIRRLAALLSILLLVQLTLAGTGAACAAHDPGREAGQRGHEHGAGQVASIASLAGDTAQPAGEMLPPDGCTLPWAPGTCVSMMSCAATVLPSTALIAMNGGATGGRPAASAFLAPPQPVRAPELPPPRA